ncbi:MAG: chorismate synthase [Firmicutes bacterium]|nr:chorismate synthase [Bacillota bacterium]
MRFLTAGESHGCALAVVIEGFPALVPIGKEEIDRELSRRQQGYGRGGRMKVEKDRVEIISGLRHGKTLGSPIAFLIPNRDWQNWAVVIDPFLPGEDTHVELKEDQKLGRIRAEVTAPRPGHADLAGGLKYGFTDLRNVLERASARETAARVGAGAFARALLAQFGVVIGSHVLQIGTALTGESHNRALNEEEQEEVEKSPVRCLDPRAAAAMVDVIDKASAEGESLGGIFLVYAKGLPPGLGSHVHWDRRLDGRLAQAVMSIPGVKGVEFGLGFAAAGLAGSKVHDPIAYQTGRGLYRPTNNAGGIEGGISNGESLIVRAVMKPIPTLYQGLPSLDLKTWEPVRAAVERSDLTAVPAAGVVAEAMVAWVLAEAFLEKFGGDSLPEMKKAWAAYLEEIPWQPLKS